MKWFPLSLVRLRGHPNLEMMFSKINLVVVSAVQSLTDAASSHLARHSIVVMIYLAWERHAGGLIGSINSTVHFSKIYSAHTGCKGSSSRCDGFPTLWIMSHFLAYSFTFLKIVGHQSFACSIFLVVPFLQHGLPQPLNDTPIIHIISRG